jgi:hypothetical protein
VDKKDGQDRKKAYHVFAHSGSYTCLERQQRNLAPTRCSRNDDAEELSMMLFSTCMHEESVLEPTSCRNHSLPLTSPLQTIQCHRRSIAEARHVTFPLVKLLLRLQYELNACSIHGQIESSSLVISDVRSVKMPWRLLTMGTSTARGARGRRPSMTQPLADCTRRATLHLGDLATVVVICPYSR